MFIYEDDVDSQPTGSYKMSVTGAGGGQTFKKCIHLIPEFCTCERSAKVKDNYFVFVLTTHSRENSARKKRKFRASSAEDLDAWMESIKIAMVVHQPRASPTRRPTLGGGGSPRVNALGVPLKKERSKRRIGVNSAANSIETVRRPSLSPNSKRRGAISPQLITQQLLYSSETSLPGPAVVHAENVSNFCGVRNSLTKSTDGMAYEEAIRYLARSGATVKIPVFFIKVLMSLIYYIRFTNCISTECISFIWRSVRIQF
jgi:hypothetical protein